MEGYGLKMRNSTHHTLIDWRKDLESLYSRGELLKGGVGSTVHGSQI